MSKKRYAARVPRTANGFRAQELRNVPRGAWWAKRWLQAIDALRLGARAGRGRLYAERGQVLALSASGSHVEATVLGCRPDPYTVKIDFRPLPGKGLTSKKEAMIIGRILAGEMPIAVEEMFAQQGLSPYPTLGVDRFWCSCPDWSKPCKHIAAALYLIGDALVRDPAILLRLRGVEPILRSSGESVLPLWKGTMKLSGTLEGIYRRVGVVV